MKWISESYGEANEIRVALRSYIEPNICINNFSVFYWHMRLTLLKRWIWPMGSSNSHCSKIEWQTIEWSTALQACVTRQNSLWVVKISCLHSVSQKNTHFTGSLRKSYRKSAVSTVFPKHNSALIRQCNWTQCWKTRIFRKLHLLCDMKMSLTTFWYHLQ